MITKNINVLLAEDDEGDRLLFKEVLKEVPLPTTLTMVHDGEQLIKLLQKKTTRRFDVLFLDLNMPRKNGFAALAEIKRNSKWARMPVIIFTTADDPDMVNQVYKDAAHFYIHKPNSFAELKKAIEKALAHISVKNFSLPGKADFVLTGDVPLDTD